MVSEEPRRLPPRVLVVDDEPDLRFVVRHILARGGRFDVVGEAADGQEAIGLAAELQPDIVVLDLLMPTPGETALPHILRVAPTCMVAVFSALDPDSYRDRLLSSGAFACYAKSRSDELPDLLENDHRQFLRALRGEDVVATWAATPRL